MNSPAGTYTYTFPSNGETRVEPIPGVGVMVGVGGGFPVLRARHYAGYCRQCRSVDPVSALAHYPSPPGLSS